MHHEDEYIENHHENLLMSLTNTETERHKVLIWYTYTIWRDHSSDTMLHSCPLHVYDKSQILGSKWANMQLGSSS